MRRSKWWRWLLAGSIVAGCLCVAVRPSGAVEEARKFLDGLRERGYYDTALEYLEQVRTNRMVGKEFQEVIDYEAGVTLIYASQTGRQMSVREQQLGEAREKFQKFISEHPQHPLAAGAKTQLANLLVERGRIKVEQSAAPNLPPAEKKQLMDDARKLYQDAQKEFADLEERFLEEHKKFPKFIDPKEAKKIEARDQVRRDLLQARLALATVVYEIAQTYDPGSQGNKDNLTAAAKKYYELYEKYGTRLAGLYARMWEGRCYKELGDTKKAFEAFDELLSQPDEPPAFRVLKSKSAILALETALLPEVKKHKEALAMYKEWEKASRGDEETSVEGLAIRYLTGEAALQYARSLKERKDAQVRADNIKEARILFTHVARYPGEYQKQARSKLRLPDFGDPGEVAEPANFAEACDRARDALDRTQDPDLKPEETADAQAEAIKYYRMAMAMKTADVTADEMNVIRYYLAYLYWMSDELYEAAVVGEFLARRYSGGTGARQGARIAMAAWVRLYNEAPPDDRQFETDRMVGIADYITKRWEGEPEADEAWMMLIRTALSTGQLDEAQEYLKNVSPDSLHRGEVELMTGQELWRDYLKRSRLPEGERPSQAELDQRVQQARKILEDGINRMRKPVDEGGELSYTLVASVLSLAQMSIGAGEPDKAVKWLDDPKIGARTLVAKNHEVTDRGNFRVETYKAALRAYVGVQEVAKAEEAMNSLEKLIGGDAEASRKLTQIYISLGRTLQDQLERLKSENKLDELDKVSHGFELFLDQISQRGAEGNTFNSLNWVAETFFGMGAGFDPGGKKLPAEAEKYYAKARENYENILKLCQEKKIEFQPGATTSVKIRLAKCLRRLGQHQEALGHLLEILKTRSTMIDAQVEAAYTYQALGGEKPGYYLLAIKGSTKHKEVWGWGQLSRRLSGMKKYLSVFHEARYNLALCRFNLALSKTNKTERAALLEQAEKDITVVQRLYDNMGKGILVPERLYPKEGEDWYERYDDLLKKIQKLRGAAKPLGLKGTAPKK